ncbi:hypothetical protein [Sporosarcina psychrophila]|uniref:hypothetical protein n=1 Tax=Sporosarcina psychrophila TaxID=1476 RepID=UPI00078CD8BF|nr:hypothetical protein [Sporosarcina psychrophila]AMQ05228.1 hypothetical protein AZE41_04350 [Sporosarcina psychrophila]
MPKSNKATSFNPLIIMAICLVAGIFIACIVLYLIFGDLKVAFNKMLELQGQPSRTAPSVASISYIVTWILTIYSIVVTAIFSYMVWKINNRSLIISEELKEFEVASNNENKELTKQSLQISEDLRRIEETKEFEQKRSKALIIYYDLQRGFTIIRDLYIKHILKNEKLVLDQAFFDNNWIENVAYLRTDLSNKDIQDLYSLYNSLYTIQKYLESEDVRLIGYIEKFSEKVFLDFIPISLMGNLREHDVEELLSVEKYILMHKLYRLTFSKAELGEEENEMKILSVNHYKIKSGNLYNGEVILYNSYGYERLKGTLVDGEFATGEYTGYFGVKSLYRIEYQTILDKRLIIKGILNNFIFESLKNEYLIDADYIDGKPYNGKIISIRKNGTVAYWGEIVDGEKHGHAKNYNDKGKIIFDGEYEHSRAIKGKLYRDGKLEFDGELYNGDPWSGKSFENDLDKINVKKFTGEILEGKPVEGNGLIFKRSAEASSLNELEAIEEMDEVWHYQHEEQMLSEEYEEEHSRWHNESIRSKYREWEDYICADWKNGEYSEKEDKQSNIQVYYYPRSEIK